MTEILHRRTRLENTTLNRGCGGRSHNRIVQYARAGAGFLPSTVPLIFPPKTPNASDRGVEGGYDNYTKVDVTCVVRGLFGTVACVEFPGSEWINSIFVCLYHLGKGTTKGYNR